jgi:predicted nucleic acid-binding protein
VNRGFYLLDANILVYAANTSSPFNQIARGIRDRAARGTLEGCVCPQVMLEFFAIITDPRRVETPLTFADAHAEVEKYQVSINIRKVYPRPTTMATTLELMKRHKIRRQKVFDTYLVATMSDNGIAGIYTNNDADFRRYSRIDVINPFRK